MSSLLTAVDQVSLENIEMQLTHKMTDSMTQGRRGKWPKKGSEMSISWTWGHGGRGAESEETGSDGWGQYRERGWARVQAQEPEIQWEAEGSS